MEIAIVIPALNEEESLPTVLAELPEGLIDKTIVVDNGSSDRTAEVAEGAGARVVREQRHGYGYACAAGAAAALEADVLVFMDGDGSDDPRQIPSLVGPIEREEADLVLGARILDAGVAGAMFPHQRLGNVLVTRLVRFLYGQNITDLPPFRAIRRPVLEGLDMREMTYGWPTEMIVKCLRLGYRATEVQVRVRPRIAGRSKVSGTAKGTILAAYHILAVSVKYARGEIAGDSTHITGA